ncbi:MAG: NADH-quinone oxidoreductase subunit A [Verrucomicrobiota bacterium]
MGPEFTDNYLPIALQIVIAVGFAVSALLLSVAFGRSARRNKAKDSAYECGMLPVGDGQARFSVKFYLVAMLFVLFDIEVVFMYPWAVVFRDFVDAGKGPAIFWAMMGFVGILTVAYVYALKKGAFNWAEQR